MRVVEMGPDLVKRKGRDFVKFVFTTPLIIGKGLQNPLVSGIGLY